MTGWLAELRSQLRAWLAADPEPPAQWTPPRGLGLLPGLLADVASSPRSAVLPPIQRDAAGTSLLTASEWCTRAGLEPAVGVLAVLLASEAPSIYRYPAYAWAIGEATINAARAHRKNATDGLESAILARVVGDSRPALDGHFAAQGGRWASTRQQPTRQHVRCAELVLARACEPNIIAHGAVQWLDLRTQVAMNRKKPATNPPPDMVIARRYDSGRKWIGPVVDVMGEVVIDPFIVMMFGPEGVPYGEALEAERDGRRRWRL